MLKSSGTTHHLRYWPAANWNLLWKRVTENSRQISYDSFYLKIMILFVNILCWKTQLDVMSTIKKKPFHQLLLCLTEVCLCWPRGERLSRTAVIVMITWRHSLHWAQSPADRLRSDLEYFSHYLHISSQRKVTTNLVGIIELSSCNLVLFMARSSFWELKGTSPFPVLLKAFNSDWFPQICLLVIAKAGWWWIIPEVSSAME